MDDVRRYRRLVPTAVAFSVLTLVALLAWSASRDGDLKAALDRLDWRFLPLALSLHVAAHLFWAARYASIAQAAGIPLGAPQAWRIVTAGVFGGAVTPGKIGGEGLKLALLLRRGVPTARAGRILLVDRAADLVFFLLMGLVAAALLPPLFGADATAARAFALVGTAFLGLFLLVLIAVFAWPAPTARVLGTLARPVLRRLRRPDAEGRIQEVVADVRDGVVDLAGRRPGLMIGAALLTAANWIVEYGVLWTLLLAFGHDVPYWMVFFVGIVLTLVSNIPITPGGSGVAELAALALLTPLAPGLTPLFVVAWRGATYFYDLIAGGVMAALMLPGRTLSGRHGNP